MDSPGVNIPKYLRQAKELTRYAFLTRYPGVSGPVLEPHQIGKQLLAAGDEPIALDGPHGAIRRPRRRPDADGDDHHRERQRDPPRRGAVVRDPVEQ